jgi:type I restriction enzyme M protein
MSPKGGIKPHNRLSVQSKRSKVLFVDYMAEHLTPTGRAGIIVPEGIIFQSQTAYKRPAEAACRKRPRCRRLPPGGLFQSLLWGENLHPPPR